MGDSVGTREILDGRMVIRPFVVRTMGVNINPNTVESVRRAGFQVVEDAPLDGGSIFRFIEAVRPGPAEEEHPEPESVAGVRRSARGAREVDVAARRRPLRPEAYRPRKSRLLAAMFTASRPERFARVSDARPGSGKGRRPRPRSRSEPGKDLVIVVDPRPAIEIFPGFRDKSRWRSREALRFRDLARLRRRQRARSTLRLRAS